MEEIDEDGKRMIRLNMETADYFLSRLRSALNFSRKAAKVYAISSMVMVVVVLFNLSMVLEGDTAFIGTLAICVFWVGFLAYRSVSHGRSARKTKEVLDGLLTRIGDYEIRRALEDGGHDDE